MKGAAFALLASAAALSLTGPRAAHAQQDASCLSVVRRLPSLVDRTRCPLALGAGAGYGYTESVLGQGDAHHRLMGALGAEWTALPALVLGLRLDGRYDRHLVPGQQANDDGWTGEPRLFGRWEKALGPHRLALALGVNLPAGEAPSVDFGAMGGDLSVLGTRDVGSVDLTAKLGYRLDRAARAVPAAAQLSATDRVGLGINAFNAVLVGLGAEHRGRALALFAEATLDALLGAPAASQWPLRLGAGARRGLGGGVAGELLLEAVLSARPSVAPRAPLVEIPPRIAVLAGLTWGQGAPALPPAPPPAPPPPPVVTEEPPAPRGQLRGSVRSYGGRGIAATIRIARPGDDHGPPTTLESRAGNFEIDLAPGSYDVVIEAPAFVTQRRRITVEENGVVLLNVDLRRAH